MGGMLNIDLEHSNPCITFLAAYMLAISLVLHGIILKLMFL